jgi:hypothetical protein
MEHVVFYPSAEGAPSFRRVSSLDEAVNFVEHLRNVESVTEFSVHALTPVPLAFRAYYRVEVPAGDEQVPAQAASPWDEAEAPAELSATAADASDEPAAASTDLAAQSGESADVTMAPVEASDDDRSLEWVAAASVVEAAVAQAPVEEVPAAEEAVATEAAGDELVAVGAVAPVPNAPFAEAPPVTPPAMEALVKDAAPASEPLSDTDVAPESVITDVVPSSTGRRSMGFFTR